MSLSLRYFAINRTRDVDRKEHMIKLGKQINVNMEFFTAINGSDLNVIDTSINSIKLINHNNDIWIHDTNNYNPYHGFQPPTYNVLGCALSHQALYKQLIMDDNSDAYCIFEDDVHYIPEDVELYHKAIQTLPNHTQLDLCLLYEPRFCQGKLDRYNEYFARSNKLGYAGAFAYIITKRGAAKLLVFINGAVNKSPDDYLSDFSWSMEPQIFVAPFFGFSDERFPSTTGELPTIKKVDGIWNKEFTSRHYRDLDDLKLNFKRHILSKF